MLMGAHDAHDAGSWGAAGRLQCAINPNKTLKTVGSVCGCKYHLNIPRVLKPRMCGVKKEIGGPNRPYDAHDAGSWGAAECLKCAIQPNKTLKMHAVGSVCACKYQCW